MSASKAKVAANARYDSKTYERITFRIKRGDKPKIEEAAKMAGLSLNGFISEAVDEKIEKQGERL